MGSQDGYAGLLDEDQHVISVWESPKCIPILRPLSDHEEEEEDI